METVLLGAVTTLGGGVIAYLLNEVKALRRERWQLLQVIYENTEAMKKYADMRRNDGPGSR